jgi:hypothetical protein
LLLHGLLPPALLLPWLPPLALLLLHLPLRCCGCLAGSQRAPVMAAVLLSRSWALAGGAAAA